MISSSQYIIDEIAIRQIKLYRATVLLYTVQG